MESFSAWRFAMAATLAVAPSWLAAQDVNVAPSGTTTQSSEYPAGGFPALNGTDGDYANFTHTGAGLNLPSTWQDDLGAVFPIKTINLFNRADCCQLRLRDITVTVLEADGVTIAYQSELLNPENGDGNPLQITVDLVAETGGPVDGRIVRVAREPDPDFSGQGGLGSADDADVLSLAEVEILVDPSTVPLRITKQPAGARLYAGDNYTFSVNAFGAEPISYQWKKGPDEIAGATERTLALQGLKVHDSGVYSVVVSNTTESVTSDPAELEVPGRDLALYGTATQSSATFGHSAGLAINGIVDGDFNRSRGSQTRETGDAAPWWEVALPATSTVDSIVIWNRTDCCSSRLTNFRVLLLNANRVEVFRQDYFTDGVGYPDTTADGFAIALAANTRGRFVRIEILGPNSEGSTILALAEVEVFGMGQSFSAGDNLARRRSASVSQTSTLGGFVAGLGNNGNYSDFTHTLAATNLPSAWELDLGETFPLGEIVLHNRVGCCGSRLRDITVYILDAPGGAIQFASEILNEENVLGVFPGGPATLGVNLVQELGSGVNGRAIRVERTPDEDLSGTQGQGNADEADVLSLAEVEVFPFVECPELGDTHCRNVTVVGPDGGGPGAYQVTAAADDESLDPVLFLFTATRGGGITYTVGPQPENTAELNLGIGTWTIAVQVDDNPRCDDEAVDAACSTTVEVEGCGNVALGATATQSSDFGGGAFPAANALNGSLDDFTHTEAGVNLPATWEVELGATFQVRSIVLHNRTSCCGSRLRDITVSILSADGQTTAYESELLNAENALGLFPDGPASLTVDLIAETGGAVAGGRVRVLRTPDEDLSGTQGQGNTDEADVLSLAEVEVEACSGDVEPPGPRFVRGDANADGRINITDPIFSLAFSFQGGPAPPCREAADADDSFGINITDPIYVLSYLFQGGPRPPAPSPSLASYVPGDCGPDTTADNLDCLSFPPCVRG